MTTTQTETYYIGTGAKNCFYTLRYTFSEPWGETTVTRDYHVQNLSTDAAEAERKAREIVGQKLGAEFSVQPILRRSDIDWSVFQAGQHISLSIHEVSELPKGKDYLVWVCENMSKSKNYEKTVELAKALVSHELAQRAGERDEKAALAVVNTAKRVALLSPIADVIADGKGAFCDSIADDMRKGDCPRGRGASLVTDIYAKQHGRRNSAAYSAAYEVAANALEEAEALV